MFLSFIPLSEYFVEACSFPVFNFFFPAALSSSNVKCPILMSNRFISDFRDISDPILEMLFPFLKTFFMPDSV